MTATQLSNFEGRHIYAGFGGLLHVGQDQAKHLLERIESSKQNFSLFSFGEGVGLASPFANSSSYA